MSAPDPDWDDEYAALLAAYDTQLSSGDTSPEHFDPFRSRLPDDVSNRLADAKSCLLLLKQVWRPSKRIGSRVRTLARRFEIVRELGRGGFGIVYLANDTVLGRTVALKVQRPEAILSASLRDRFVREAKAAARLRHPNIAAVYEMGDEGLRFWIATEYCDGDSLASLIGPQTSKIEPTAIAGLMAALADALEYSHQEGVLHRDLKPSNVLLQRVADQNGPDVAPATTLSAFTPKLIDFGLAKLLESEQQETRSGALLGTPAYMAPEQASGQVRQIGPATDIYGLGTILYELLTGRPVFRGASDADTLRQIVTDEPVNPRQLRLDLARDLEAICLKCLQKQPDKRYPTAGALAADLRRFLQGVPTEARPLTFAQRLVKWTRRRPAFAGLLAVCVAASLTFVVLNAVYIRQLKTGRETADALRTEAEDSAESARQQERLASRYMYVSQMRHAYEWLEQGEVQRVEQMLDQYKPGSRLANLRGFEWYHLKRKLHGEQLSLNGHRGEVYAVAFSPDGRVLASGGQDGTIKLWDPKSGQALATIAAHGSCVNAVEFSPDRQILASASCDHSIKLWQVATHELLATLEGHSDEVHCLAISPDGRLLASGGNDRVALVWDLAARKIVKSFNADSGTINSLVWYAGSQELVVAASQNLFVWDLGNDRQTTRGGPVQSIAISPAASEVALGHQLGVTVLAKDFSTPIEEPAAQFNGGPRALAFSADGAWLASGAGDGTIHIWARNQRQRALRETLTGHTARVQSLAFAPHGDLLASASFDGTVKLWKPIQGEALPWLESDFFLPDRCDFGGLVALSPDFHYVAWPSSLCEAKVFDLHNGVFFDPVMMAREPIRGLNFLAGAQPILFGIPKDSEHVSICHVLQRKFAGSFLIPPDIAAVPPEVYGTAGAPRQMVLSPDGRQFIATNPQCATISDTRSGEVWCQLSCHVSPGIRFSPDANFVAIAVGSEPACLANLSLKKYERSAWKNLCAVSNGGKLVANGLNPVTLVELASGRELCTLRHSVQVRDAVFSPDARTFVTGTSDGCVHLWNVATGEIIARFETRSGEILKVQFSSDSRKLAAFTFSDVTPVPEGRPGTMRLFIWEGIDGP